MNRGCSFSNKPPLPFLGHNPSVRTRKPPFFLPAKRAPLKSAASYRVAELRRRRVCFL